MTQGEMISTEGPIHIYTKDIIKMVPIASLLSAQPIGTGLASLSSQTSFKKRDGYHQE